MVGGNPRLLQNTALMPDVMARFLTYLKQLKIPEKYGEQQGMHAETLELPLRPG